MRKFTSWLQFPLVHAKLNSQQTNIITLINNISTGKFMESTKKHTFTFVVDFRGGTYCSQVEAENAYESTINWVENLKKEKKEIKFLGDKVIEELNLAVHDETNKPANLTGLKNIWYNNYRTRKGFFNVNIVQTCTDK